MSVLVVGSYGEVPELRQRLRAKTDVAVWDPGDLRDDRKGIPLQLTRIVVTSAMRAEFDVKRGHRMAGVVVVYTSSVEEACAATHAPGAKEVIQAHTIANDAQEQLATFIRTHADFQLGNDRSDRYRVCQRARNAGKFNGTRHDFDALYTREFERWRAAPAQIGVSENNAPPGELTKISPPSGNALDAGRVTVSPDSPASFSGANETDALTVLYGRLKPVIERTFAELAQENQILRGQIAATQEENRELKEKCARLAESCNALTVRLETIKKCLN